MIDIFLASTIKLAQVLPVHLEYIQPNASFSGGKVENRNPMPVSNITIDYSYMEGKVRRTGKYLFREPLILKPGESTGFSLPYRGSQVIQIYGIPRKP
jgi:hypothetical protein